MRHVFAVSLCSVVVQEILAQFVLTPGQPTQLYQPGMVFPTVEPETTPPPPEVSQIEGAVPQIQLELQARLQAQMQNVVAQIDATGVLDLMPMKQYCSEVFQLQQQVHAEMLSAEASPSQLEGEPHAKAASEAGAAAARAHAAAILWAVDLCGQSGTAESPRLQYPVIVECNRILAKSMEETIGWAIQARKCLQDKPRGPPHLEKTEFPFLSVVQTHSKLASIFVLLLVGSLVGSRIAKQRMKFLDMSSMRLPLCAAA